MAPTWCDLHDLPNSFKCILQLGLIVIDTSYSSIISDSSHQPCKPTGEGIQPSPRLSGRQASWRSVGCSSHCNTGWKRCHEINAKIAPVTIKWLGMFCPAQHGPEAWPPTTGPTTTWCSHARRRRAPTSERCASRDKKWDHTTHYVLYVNSFP